MRVLVANRGEIAVRIIRACREMGISTVAVYSDADRTALHTRLADQAVYLGESSPRASYLNIAKLINAAVETGADAIHPGYGFLAENADFAEAVLNAGLTFIGPSPRSIREMGDKAEARRRMAASGVPVVPGYQESDDDSALGRAAVAIGYPVLLKAVGGGGGKAMRVVSSPEQFDAQLSAARREALHAFGDRRVLLEKYIPDARHIEVQVLADKRGNSLHLFERECSLQRRYQKVVEESPSPFLDDTLRARMCETALAAARAVRYENAGTVEFIVDPATREFYFLEMNTRLQVEHPVTEMTLGLDLVQWQIRIARGEPLDLRQSELEPRGHAVECRIYAEDPARGFLPAAGRILALEVPDIPGVRADAGIAAGDTVSPFYDPLLLKLIAHAETRGAALDRLVEALRQLVLLGLETNLEFLQSLLNHPRVRAGDATIRFIDEYLWKPDSAIPRELLAGLAATALLQSESDGQPTAPDSDPYSPWRSRDAYRMGAT